MGSASASGSSLNLPAANEPPLSKVSEDEDEDDDDDGSEMIIGNLFPHGPRSQVTKNQIDAIVQQIKVMQENEEILVGIHGKEE